MRAIVTGGAGFIGSHVVDALIAAGHTVTVIDNLVTGSIDNLTNFSLPPPDDISLPLVGRVREGVSNSSLPREDNISLPLVGRAGEGVEVPSSAGSLPLVGPRSADSLPLVGRDREGVSSFTRVREGVELVELDVRDSEALTRTFERVRPGIVFHLAAQTLVNSSSSDPVRDAHINVMGTLNVVQAAIAAGARKLVFASSGGTVYGNALTQPVDESRPLNPISPYGVSKVAGEHYVRVLCGHAGMASTILRYGNVYGPRDIPQSHHVITSFLDALLNDERPIIEWDGEQAKDYVYVGDVADAHVRAITAGDGEAFNIASGGEISVNEIFRLVCQAMQVDVEPRRADRRPADVRRFVLDCRKAGRLLGWTPATSFAAGLAETVRYYRATDRSRRIHALASS